MQPEARKFAAFRSNCVATRLKFFWRQIMPFENLGAAGNKIGAGRADAERMAPSVKDTCKTLSISRAQLYAPAVRGEIKLTRLAGPHSHLHERNPPLARGGCVTPRITKERARRRRPAGSVQWSRFGGFTPRFCDNQSPDSALARRRDRRRWRQHRVVAGLPQRARRGAVSLAKVLIRR